MIPGSERSLGVENGNPLQYSCLENPMDRGAWQATVYTVAEPDVTEVTQHIAQGKISAYTPIMYPCHQHSDTACFHCDTYEKHTCLCYS